MTAIIDLIRKRRSVRTFASTPLSAEHITLLKQAMEQAENPYGIPVEFRLLDPAKHKLISAVINGDPIYVGAKIPAVPHFEAAFGYSFERFLLYGESLGIGSVWLGGTFKREGFQQAMELTGNELMPCASPLGYPAEKMSVKETLMRKAVKADSRRDFETLFFRDSFDTPLSPEEAGDLRIPLEAVRLAPSSINRQPWRAVVTDDAVHFYKHGKNDFEPATGDMLKIDVGIALCHFHLATEEAGITTGFSLAEPAISIPDGTEYIASFLLR